MNIKSNTGHAGKFFGKPALWLYCVILCVALLASYSLGWYITSVVNADNRIRASVFDMTAQVLAADGSQVKISAENDGTLSAALAAGNTYTVNLGCSNKSNGHGCCVVSVNGENYQTVVFGKCGADNCGICEGRQSLQFTVVVPAGDNVEIKLIPQWGAKPLAEGAQEIASGAAIPYAS